SQLFVGLPAGNGQQVTPVLLFGISVDQDVLGCIVHASQVPGVLRIAAPPFPRRRLQDQDAGAGFARTQGGAQGGVAAPDYKYIEHESIRVRLISGRTVVAFAPTRYEVSGDRYSQIMNTLTCQAVSSAPGQLPSATSS